MQSTSSYVQKLLVSMKFLTWHRERVGDYSLLYKCNFFPVVYEMNIKNTVPLYLSLKIISRRKKRKVLKNENENGKNKQA